MTNKNSPQEVAMDKWAPFLQHLYKNKKFDVDYIELVFEFLREIDSIFSLLRLMSIPPTQAGPTPEGYLQLVWDIKNHHLEVDIKPTGHFDWFYRDRATQFHTGDEDCLIWNLPERFLYSMRFFCENYCVIYLSDS